MSLKLKNFRPYRGDHEIDLSPAEGNGLIVIHGNNLYGKTALFLALKWCLYGRVKDNKEDYEYPVFKPGGVRNKYLINADAVRDGSKEMQVEVVFEHEGDTWELTRRATCSGDPLDGDNFDPTKALLRIGDAPIDAALIKSRINDVLHEESVPFYLFDGELLSEYERWLADEDRGRTKVKDAIERTVGISAFRLGKGFFDDVYQGFQNDVVKLGRKEERNKKTIKDRDLLVRKKEEVEGEIEGFKQSIIGKKAESQRIQDAHGELAEWEKAVQRISSLDGLMDDARNRQTGAEVEIQNLVREKYWLILHGVAAEQQQQRLAELKEAIRSRHHLVSPSIEDGVCALCDQALDTSAKTHLKQLLEGGENLELDDIEKALIRIKSYTKFCDSSAMDQLKAQETILSGARIDFDQWKTEQESLRESHRVRGERKKEMARLGTLSQEIGEFKEKLKGAKEDLDGDGDKKGIVGELEALDEKIVRASKSDPALLRSRAAAKLATAALDNALDIFAQNARQKVQEIAHQVFQVVVNEELIREGFAGVKIDENYVVSPINEAGEVWPDPSAGGQQLLTLALIGGLNGAAALDAPIVMDTPLGRLDEGHRENILQWLTSLVEKEDKQVILMVHSGEVERESFNKWGIAPGRSYNLVSDTDGGRRIQPRS